MINQEPPLIHSDADATAAIAARDRRVVQEWFAIRYGPLVAPLGARGIALVGLYGAEDHVGGKKFSRHFVFDGMTMRERSGDEGLVVVDAARCLTGGIARKTPEVAALNPLAVREIVMSKMAQYNVLREAMGGAVPLTYAAVAGSEDVRAAIHALPGNKAVVKLDKGANSNGVLMGDKQHILRDLAELEVRIKPGSLVIVQEYMPEVTSLFALDDAAVDEAERQKLEDLRGSREIRVHTIDGEPFLVHGRAGSADGHGMVNDKWVFIDQEAVPDDVLSLARRAASTIHKESGSPDSYLAVDITPDGTRIVEVNGRQPQPIMLTGESVNADKAHALWIDALATKLATMAKRNQPIRD